MEETGKPYERVLTDISTGAQKKAEYLAINPMGKVRSTLSNQRS
jgi:glutathione S-transferase